MKNRKACSRSAAGILLVAFLVTVPVAGQSLPEGQAPALPGVSYPGLPSANTALGLTVAGTVAALVSMYSRNGYIAWAGLTFGPSLGFFYGGCWGRGLLTAGLRFCVTAAAIAVAFNDDLDETWGYMWLGGLAVSAVVDMATVKRAVSKHNARIAARRGLQLNASPFVLPKGAGVRLQLSF